MLGKPPHDHLPPSLHLCIDRGSIGIPGSMWLLGRHQLVGTLHGDWCHDEWNAFQAACANANVWLPILERVVVCNLPSGPWKGGKFFGQIKETGAYMFRHFDHTCAIFQLLFSRIAEELQDRPIDEGSNEHMMRVWDRISTSKCMTRKGMRVRTGRWYQLFVACDQGKGVQGGADDIGVPWAA